MCVYVSSSYCFNLFDVCMCVSITQRLSGMLTQELSSCFLGYFDLFCFYHLGDCPFSLLARALIWCSLSLSLSLHLSISYFIVSTTSIHLLSTILLYNLIIWTYYYLIIMDSILITIQICTCIIIVMHYSACAITVLLLFFGNKD